MDLADNHSKEVRSKNMSHIRSTNSKPEEIVRRYLFSKGLRYRKNVRTLPGKPDIVLPKYKTIVFVNGCFWHMHGCSRSRLPKSNLDYWKPKLEKNLQRDKIEYEELKSLGWKIIIVWECELKKKVQAQNLERIKQTILGNE